MKTSHWAAISAAVVAVGTLMSTPAFSQTDPIEPIGFLTAYPTIVQTGTKPTLTWNILFPAKIGLTDGGSSGSSGGSSGGSGGGNDGSDDPVLLDPPGTLIPTDPVYVTVQIVGTDVTNCVPGQDSLSHYSDARVSINDGPYEQIFYGTQSDVPPSKKLFIKKLAANDTLDFGGRYVLNGAWSPFYTTRSRNFQIVALVNGQTPPTSLPGYLSPQLASFLKPYLDSTGKVKIGPLSVLILMELGQTNPNSPCFDHQDQVLLVTFSKKHPNNGHGNNLDGVDVSNPGNGHGGPNGEVDPSGGVDDEAR
jgi:hypothetical protein